MFSTTVGHVTNDFTILLLVITKFYGSVKSLMISLFNRFKSAKCPRLLKEQASKSERGWVPGPQFSGKR